MASDQAAFPECGGLLRVLAAGTNRFGSMVEESPETVPMTEQPNAPKPPRQWHQPPLTVGELIDALKRHDPDMPVVVNGYEEGYDSLTADSIAVISIVPDAAKADLTGIVGDHERPEKIPEADAGEGWGGGWARSYRADAKATAPVMVLLLSRAWVRGRRS